MTWTKRCGFAISILLHIALFFSFRSWIPRVPDTPIEVELVSAPSAAETAAAIAKPEREDRRDRSRSSKRSRPSRARVDQTGGLSLSPSFVPSAHGDLELKPSAVAANGEMIDDPTAAWGSGGAEFGRVSDLGRFDKFYSYVDGQIQYPGVLAYHGIEGTVNARLIVTPQGACDWHHSTISSTQAHLRIYVLDVLKQVCSRNLAIYAHKSASTNFDLSFKFAITEHNEERLIAAEKKIVGNVFLFYRNSQQSIAEWHIGPFRGMFPVPYVALDFSWLQENYEKVMYSRDPLHDFKDHLGDTFSGEPHG